MKKKEQTFCPNCGAYFFSQNWPEGKCCHIGNQKEKELAEERKRIAAEERKAFARNSGKMLEGMFITDVMMRFLHGDWR